MDLVNHDHAQVRQLATDNPVDQCAVGDVDQSVAPVCGRGIVILKADVVAGAGGLRAVQGLSNVTGNPPGGGLARLGDHDLAVTSELLRIFYVLGRYD